ncbi:hypothetical protein MQE36_13800 [Zhouia spongiae]|uniref:Uncharacterized protein n=1 Tax=Zhouia spongiae TaxID=2202721 RepID=A0ABY3YKN2_9FLAO|nr:hypothetical protein [Zhouia spongiae]UNY98154.1 hypothetical protein MQE36_13800 [Zhouia spongiae]
MKLVKISFALLFVASLALTSCSSSSVADEDNLYQDQSPKLSDIKVPTNG